jgi:hypothetical protein
MPESTGRVPLAGRSRLMPVGKFDVCKVAQSPAGQS